MKTEPQWQALGRNPENYERYLVPSIFAPWAEDLVEVAELQAGQRVLDIACGPELSREPPLDGWEAAAMSLGWI